MSIAVGSKAPEFSLPGADGGEVRFTRGADEYTLLNFCKSTCPVCKEFVPKLSGVYDNHPNAPVRLVGVAVGSDDCPAAALFQQAADLHFPLGVDTNREVRANYGLARVPTVILIDPAGTVLRKYEGGRDEMVTAIDDALTSLEKGISVAEYNLEGGG